MPKCRVFYKEGRGLGQKTVYIKRVLLYCVLLALAFPMVWVLWFMLTGSLMPQDVLNNSIGAVLNDSDPNGFQGMASLSLFPAYTTLSPLVELLLDTPQFFVMFWNSMAIACFSALGQFLIATPAAWALSRFKFKGRGLLFSIYVVLMLLPFQVTMVPNYLVADKLNIMDTLLSVILPFAVSAFPVFIMAKGFDSVPYSLLEAAEIDGANPFKIFVYIGIPLGTPCIFSALILCFLEGWNAVEQPMIFLKSGSLFPLSLYLSEIASQNMGLAMVSSLVALFPPVLVFLFGQSYLELGIQASGIKE